MSKENPGREGPGSARKNRLAAALRTNLARRKAQSRARSSDVEATSAEDPDSVSEGDKQDTPDDR